MRLSPPDPKAHPVLRVAPASPGGEVEQAPIPTMTRRRTFRDDLDVADAAEDRGRLPASRAAPLLLASCAGYESKVLRPTCVGWPTSCDVPRLERSRKCAAMSCMHSRR
jgi:hypothetical protein